MTQPPLELLRQLQPEVETLLGFIRGAVIYHDDPKHVESVLEILTQNGLEKLDLLAICSPHEARREALIHKLMAENAALRAQAEANKGFRKALAHYAEIRHYDHAGRVWSGDVDQHEDAQIDMGEIARDALAQAAVGEEP